ncbi:MAG TPA: spermidine synthase [Thermoanaerobaculia bacterium]|nr:spermidine synthase [Thermoanaerobaculia bacterium]
MIPWTLLDSAIVPGDGGEMRLYRRGEEYSIRIGRHELMNSRAYGSEDALARLACERLRGRKHARLLIGGLGMGLTLAGAARETARDAEIVVAELVPAVVAWSRGQLAHLNGGACDDARVRIREEDVVRIIRERREAWDAILLDVDNGPAGLSAKANERLYSLAGLRAAHAGLRSGGILALWSAGSDPAFQRRLSQAGFDAEQVVVRGRGNRGARFVIWLAQRSRIHPPSGSPAPRARAASVRRVSRHR